MSVETTGPEAATGSLRTLPVVPLRGLVPMPGTPMPLAIGRQFSRVAVEQAAALENTVVLLMQKTAEEDEPAPEDFFEVGVVARILRAFQPKDGALTVVVQALERAIVEKVRFLEGRYLADFRTLEPAALADDVEVAALVHTLKSLVAQFVELSPTATPELASLVERTNDPGLLADIVTDQLDLKRDEKQQVLATIDVKERLRLVTRLAGHTLEVTELGKKIEEEVHGQLEDARRQVLLREQLKAIRKELGEEEDTEVAKIRKVIAEGALSKEARAAAERELQRLEGMSTASPERAWVVTYLEWIASLPWTRMATEREDLEEARRILDRDHWGMPKPKERILEALAVKKLKPDGRAPILCFVGPPGTGKTSLAQAVAESTGRELVRISLGGVSDESEIRGHRRTYVGALPGRIISALRKAGTRNPVFVIDEIDKMAASFHGDPAAALLEVLDPEQNATFVDRYIEVPFDLSKVLFITTANTLETLPRPLLDRLEVIEIPSYTEEEKVEIAMRHLVPKQARAVGLDPARLEISRDAVREAIAGWTRESGVRSLERAVGSVARKVALKAASGEAGPWKVGVDDLVHYLGPRRFQREVAERLTVPGVAVGLAWTPVGGEILFVEASAVPGRGRIKMTGSVGRVMRESAEAALTHLRSRLRRLADASAYDFHVHVPAGAVSKDGPSAGVAILTALASAVTGRMCRSDVAMTGEITLRGQVLPVGGIREKVMAAARAGIHLVVLPRRNEPDLDEVPPEVRESMRFVLVDWADEVLDRALEEAPVEGEADVPASGAAAT